MWGTKHGAIPFPLKVKKYVLALSVPPRLSKSAGSSLLSCSGPCADRCLCSGLLGSLPLSCLPRWEASFNPAAYASRWPNIPSCSQGKKNVPWWSAQGISAGWDLSMGDPNPQHKQPVTDWGPPSHTQHSQDAPCPVVTAMPLFVCPAPCEITVARVAVPQSLCPQCAHKCVLVAVSARFPHGSRLEAEASVSQTHFLADRGWGKGQALFVSPHSFTQSQPG